LEFLQTAGQDPYLCFFSEEEYDGVKAWLRKRLGHTRAWRFAEDIPDRLLAAPWFRRLAGLRSQAGSA